MRHRTSPATVGRLRQVEEVVEDAVPASLEATLVPHAVGAGTATSGVGAPIRASRAAAIIGRPTTAAAEGVLLLGASPCTGPGVPMVVHGEETSEGQPTEEHGVVPAPARDPLPADVVLDEPKQLEVARLVRQAITPDVAMGVAFRAIPGVRTVAASVDGRATAADVAVPIQELVRLALLPSSASPLTRAFVGRAAALERVLGVAIPALAVRAKVLLLHGQGTTREASIRGSKVPSRLLPAYPASFGTDPTA